MTPEDLYVLRLATPQCPEWGAEPYSTHITVWPKADYARVFRVLAYWYGCSYSDLFRRMVNAELVNLVDKGILDTPPRVSKGVTARARVGADVVPDDVADGVRELRDIKIGAIQDRHGVLVRHLGDNRWKPLSDDEEREFWKARAT